MNFNKKFEESIHEFQSFFGSTVDDNLIIRYEEHVEYVTFMIYQTRRNNEEVILVEKTFEDLCSDSLVDECIRQERTHWL